MREPVPGQATGTNSNKQANGSAPTLRIVVAATYFPSRIQPWVLNSVEQLILHGGRPTMFANRRMGRTWPESFDRLGLNARTCYVRPGEPKGLWIALRLLGSRHPVFGPATRSGIRRVLADPPDGPRRTLSALALAPAYGLRDTDVIHCHSTVIGYHMVDVARSLDVPLILTFHGLPPTGVAILPEEKRQRLFDASARILVNTRFAKRQVVARGAREDIVEILPQGVPLDRLAYQPKTHEPGAEFRLLTVGRLHPDKGHRHAIEAVRRLREKGYSIQYRIVGVGPLRDALERQAAEAGLADSVRFLGELTDEELAQEYRGADVFVLPSVKDREGKHEETQGVVMQEAQACGVIVVATRTGGIPECLDAGKSAFLAEERDPDSLAAAIETVLAAPERWPEWQAAGRGWVEEHFDLRKIGARQWAIMSAVVAAHRGEAAG